MDGSALFFTVFLFATLIQVAAWGMIFGPFSAKKTQQLSSRPASPVSIIVCARNEAAALKQNLPFILAQNYPAPWELIVVDDDSTDATAAVLFLFQEKYPERLRSIRIHPKLQTGKKAALTKGIEAARYASLLLTDADCVPAGPEWLMLMAGVLQSASGVEIVLGYSPVQAERPTCLHEWQRFETAFTAAQYFSFAHAGLPYMGVGRNLAYRRSIFEAAGGFIRHNHLASGDDDLLVNAVATAKNTRFCLAPASFVQTRARPDWRSWLHQKKRHLEAGTVYHLRHRFLLGILAATHAGHYFLFVILLAKGICPTTVISLFFLRLFIVWIILARIFSRHLMEKNLYLRIPFYDAGMAIYYGFVAFHYLFGGKKVDWR